MHDVGVVLDGVLLGHRHRADLGDAADVIAPEVEEHQVLGPFLGIGQQFFGKGFVLIGRFAAWPGAGDGTDCHRAVAHAHKDFRARPDNGKCTEI